MFGSFKLKLLLIVGAVVTFGAFLLRAFQAGKKKRSQEINAQTTKEVLKTVEENREIEEHLDSIEPDDKRQWLRDLHNGSS